MSKPSGTTRILHVEDEAGFAVLTATSLERVKEAHDRLNELIENLRRYMFASLCLGLRRHVGRPAWQH